MTTAGFEHEDFAYSRAGPAAAGMAPAISVYADRAHLRATLREDAASAGLRVTSAGPLSQLGQDGWHALADIVLVDCPVLEPLQLGVLADLDQRAARCGARLIVSTSVDCLDDVFACMDQSKAILLVEPNRADRVIALGQVLSTYPDKRLRELSEDDRLMLLRLTEQVGQIAGRIERLAPASGDMRIAPVRIEKPARDPVFDAGHREEARDGEARGLVSGKTAAALPDARVVRRIIRQRQLRNRYFDAELFADPAWEMLLDLTAARVEGKQVSVTSLCIASGVPPTTALRWIGQMVEAGLFVRVCDDSDRRRAFIALSDKTVEAMARYFAEPALGGMVMA